MKKSKIKIWAIALTLQTKKTVFTDKINDKWCQICIA